MNTELKLKHTMDLPVSTQYKTLRSSYESREGFKPVFTFRRDTTHLSMKQRQNMGLVIPKLNSLIYDMLDDGTKVCRCCQERKPVNFFHNTKANKDGKDTRCIDCISINRKVLYAYKKEQKKGKYYENKTR